MSFTMPSIQAHHLPTFILSAQFILGGIVRLSPFPFRSAHQYVLEKNERIAPVLYPVVPFRSAKGHNRWVGGWMLATSALLAHPDTRASAGTWGLVLFWTGAWSYSQWMVGMDFYLPAFNAALGCLGYALENGLI